MGVYADGDRRELNGRDSLLVAPASHRQKGHSSRAAGVPGRRHEDGGSLHALWGVQRSTILAATTGCPVCPGCGHPGTSTSVNREAAWVPAWRRVPRGLEACLIGFPVPSDALKRHPERFGPGARAQPDSQWSPGKRRRGGEVATRRPEQCRSPQRVARRAGPPARAVPKPQHVARDTPAPLSRAVPKPQHVARDTPAHRLEQCLSPNRLAATRPRLARATWCASACVRRPADPRGLRSVSIPTRLRAGLTP